MGRGAIVGSTPRSSVAVDSRAALARFSRLVRTQLPFALLVLAVLTVGSCKPKAGDACENDACGDEHTLLVCKHNRYLSLTCDGPKGCKAEGNTAHCDFTGNKVGSPCDDRFFGKRMCKDAKTAITCQDGKWVSYACGGPAGCTSNGDADALVKDCDATVAKEGDGCDRNFVKKPACSADGTMLLECGKDNHFGFLEHCRGPKGCASSGGEAVCDHSVQMPDDPCSPPVPEVCSADGAAILLCDGHKMFEKMCVGAHGCVVNDKGVWCDQLAPVDGGPCDKKGQKACQKPADNNDHGTLLECDGAKFRKSKKCASSCVFTRPSTYECK